MKMPSEYWSAKTSISNTLLKNLQILPQIEENYLVRGEKR